MGGAGESKMTAHQAKKLDVDSLLKFRDRFKLPLTDHQVERLEFIKPFRELKRDPISSEMSISAWWFLTQAFLEYRQSATTATTSGEVRQICGQG